jgi:hypothetical protein
MELPLRRSLERAGEFKGEWDQLFTLGPALKDKPQ